MRILASRMLDGNIREYLLPAGSCQTNVSHYIRLGDSPCRQTGLPRIHPVGWRVDGQSMKMIVLSKWQAEILKDALELLAAEEAEAAARLERRAKLASSKEPEFNRRQETEIFFAV
jgi:hypothetical protein